MVLSAPALSSLAYHARGRQIHALSQCIIRHQLSQVKFIGIEGLFRFEALLAKLIGH